MLGKSSHQGIQLPSTRKISKLAIALSAASLAGCLTAPVQNTETFPATAVGFADVGTPRGSSDWNSGLGGNALGKVKQGEVLVGFERIFSSKAHVNNQDFYRGAARFNLDSIQKKKSKFIDLALLHYKAHESWVSSADGKEPEFTNRYSCADQLWVAYGDWTPIHDKTIPTDTLITSPLPQTIDSAGISGFSIDVTNAARNWLVYPSENYGIVLVGRDEKVTSGDNSSCVTSYGDFSLEVHYTEFTELFEAPKNP
jgi:hypothetical protein